tara:strand:- start:4804 stop:5190 length:387 start_codon:yes stop_codon:yes gene_type:complete
MKDELIEFETAKLAKEKGFDELTPNLYIVDPDVRTAKANENGRTNSNYIERKDYKVYSRPTQSLLQRWLREVHKINNLNIIPDGEGNYVPWKGLLTMNNLYLFHKELKFKTYEKALEAKLQKELKLIK